MTSNDFAVLARGVYGFGAVSRVAEANKVHRSTAMRWMIGEIPPPDTAIQRLKQEASLKLAQLQRAVG